jgi:hypothetical protein
MTHGRVSIARAAELLTAAGDEIERSALSRYCDTHQLKLGKVGREVLVDFEAVQAHRLQNYTRQVMSGSELATPVARPAELDVEAAAQPAASTAPPATVTAIPAPDDPQRQLKAYELRKALRQEALEEGTLTVVAEVDAGLAEAVTTMRAAFAEVRNELAESAAAQLGVPPEKVRLLRAVLKRHERAGQERFAIRVATLLQESSDPASDAHARLMALAAHAVRLRRRPAAVQAVA